MQEIASPLLPLCGVSNRLKSYYPVLPHFTSLLDVWIHSALQGNRCKHRRGYKEQKSELSKHVRTAAVPAATSRSMRRGQIFPISGLEVASPWGRSLPLVPCHVLPAQRGFKVVAQHRDAFRQYYLSRSPTQRKLFLLYTPACQGKPKRHNFPLI